MKKPDVQAQGAYSRTNNGIDPMLKQVQSGSRAARLRKVKALFLIAAFMSFVASVSLWFLVDREQGLFVGLWVPSILALGGLLLSGSGDRR